METQERVICRLCLKICHNFKPIDGDMKDIFNVLLPRMDLAAVQEPMMCTLCAETLTRCIGFKVRCCNAHDNLVQFVEDKGAVKLNLLDVYLSKNDDCTGVSENRHVCALCMSPVKECSAVSFDIILENMIDKCLPELDLSVIKEPVICTTCLSALENCFRFVTNCLIVEDKIKIYCQALDINSKGQIDLSSLLQSTMREVTTSEVDSNWVEIIKVENQLCKERGTANGRGRDKNNDLFKLEQMVCADGKNVKVKVEPESKSVVDMEDLNFNSEGRFTSRNILAGNEECDGLNAIKTEETLCWENELEMEDQEFILNEEIEIKEDEPDFVRLEDGIVEMAPSEPYTKQISTNQDVSTVTINQCECCSYQAKNKYYLKKHLLQHRNPSEATIYKCDDCSFLTKNKCSLRTHLIQHKDPSEVTIYKCDLCLYDTKRKDHLKRHLLLHNNPSEITKVILYKCDSCLYQTKRKDHLKRHQLMHVNPLEITMYKCEYCSHQAKNKYYLEKHLLEHRDPSEITVYKCDDCTYETRNKCSLKIHLLQHKDPSELTVYKCDSCLYGTKRKDHLKRHLFLHKNPSEITVYKCASCAYKTKHIDYLKSHQRVHKDPSEITMYKCDSCPFLTKLKVGLKKHSLVHKNPSEITMYQCDSCSFRSRHKHNLKKHLLVHQNLSGKAVAVYKCDSCSFQTKYKHSLKLHCRRRHNNPEITSVSDQTESCPQNAFTSP